VDGVIAILCRKRSIPESMGELPIRYNTEWHSALIGSFFRKNALGLVRRIDRRSVRLVQVAWSICLRLAMRIQFRVQR
jgi:hypothetical protein